MEARRPDPTDSVLVDRARDGDADAFESLIRRHYRQMYLIALGILGNRMDAEDAVQDGFLQVLRLIDTCRDSSTFVPWLAQIVRNRSRDLTARRRVRRAEPLDLVDYPDRANASQAVHRAELRRILEDAMGELSEIQRQVVVKYDLEGSSHRDIAEELGISEGMSRQHLFHARQKLRQRLGPEMLREYVHG